MNLLCVESVKKRVSYRKYRGMSVIRQRLPKVNKSFLI